MFEYGDCASVSTFHYLNPHQETLQIVSIFWKRIPLGFEDDLFFL